jgi:hypothetical protein
MDCSLREAVINANNEVGPDLILLQYWRDVFTRMVGTTSLSPQLAIGLAGDPRYRRRGSFPPTRRYETCQLEPYCSGGGTHRAHLERDRKSPALRIAPGRWNTLSGSRY